MSCLSVNSKKCDSNIIVPPLSFGKENLYHPIYIIPDQTDQYVIATEVRSFSDSFPNSSAMVKVYFIESNQLTVTYLSSQV